MEFSPNFNIDIKSLRASKAFTWVCLVILGIGTGILTLLVAAAVDEGGDLFAAYFAPSIFALNVLPVLALIIALYFATGRSWIAFLAPSLLCLALTCASFFKMQLRGAPLIADDFKYITEAGNMLSEYTLRISWKIVLCAVYIAAGTVFLALMCRHRPRGLIFRLIASLASFSIIIGAGVPVYSSNGIYSAVHTSCKLGGSFSVEVEAFITRGYIYPFLHSIKDTASSPPEGYSEEEIDEVIEKYEYDDIPEDKKVNVISVMLEAYCDLSEYDSIEFTTDVYEKWHLLEGEAVRGQLLTNIFAGNTIDTERLFLTGEASLQTMSRKRQSYVWYLKEQGYYTGGFHPGDGWFYDRDSIHEYLGFDEYFFIEDFEDALPSDEYFFGKILEMYDARDKSVPYFTHNLSIQNHGGYYDNMASGPDLINREGLTDSTFYILNNYLTGIYDTNERIFEFINTLRRDPEPVVVLIYGDHKPWLGNADSVYKELGISLNAGTEEGFHNRYSTPYIIWANNAAKIELDNSFTADGGEFSPCFLMNKLFELCSWPGDEYMKLSSDVAEHITVMNNPTGLFVEDGQLTDELSDSGSKLLQELSYAAYYRRYRFDESSEYGWRKI